MTIKEKKRQAQITRIMEGLHCSREHAIEVYGADQAIENGERMDFDLDIETEKKVMKETRSTSGKAYNFTKRERKPNPTKSAIIAEIAEMLQNSDKNAYSDIKIVKKERQIDFLIGETSFTLALTQHRPPKTPK